jgi:hypothetical protein
LSPGATTDQYAKHNGIIYPIDASGALLLNANNTPTLAYAREWVLDEWKKATEENRKMAELVAPFAKAISMLGHAAQDAGEVSEGAPVPATAFHEVVEAADDASKADRAADDANKTTDGGSETDEADGSGGD